MTLRDKTREILEEGRARRGDWEPPDLPKNVYRYWAKHSRKVPARENFCHFWRVVVFWAPLMLVRRGFQRVFSKPMTYAVICGVLFFVGMGLGVFSNDGFLWVLLGLGAAVALVAAVVGSLWFANTGHVRSDSNDRSEQIACWTAFWATLPLSLPLAGIVWVVAAIGRFIDRRWTRKHTKRLQQSLVIVVSLVLTFIVVSMVHDLWSSKGVVGMSYLLGGIAVLIILAFVASRAADFVKGKRALAEKREREREAERVRKLVTLSDEEYEEWLRGRNGPRRQRTRFELAIGRVFRGIGDAVIFIAQIVRVKKWGICPYVTISTKVERN